MAYYAGLGRKTIHVRNKNINIAEWRHTVSVSICKYASICIDCVLIDLVGNMVGTIHDLRILEVLFLSYPTVARFLLPVAGDHERHDFYVQPA